jgi:Rad52/22 family double-strand break repair protein
MSDLAPKEYIEKEGKKLSLVPKAFLTEKQILKIFQRTPADHIYTRPGKGGGEWQYVTGVYVKKVLNYVFGWMWDFEVIEHGREGHQVWVLGKLTVKDRQGNSVTKTQFGRADVKLRKDGKGALDFGNDLKAATTDALKKCAAELGIASDVYGKNEFKEITPDTPPKKAETIKANNKNINALKRQAQSKVRR